MATSVPLGDCHVSCWPGTRPSGTVHLIVTTRSPGEPGTPGVSACAAAPLSGAASAFGFRRLPAPTLPKIRK